MRAGRWTRRAEAEQTARCDSRRASLSQRPGPAHCGDGPFGNRGRSVGPPDTEERARTTKSSVGTGEIRPRGGVVAYDASEIWTLTTWELCADRGAAYEAVTWHGWDWAFGGGTAPYAAPAGSRPPDGRSGLTVEPSTRATTEPRRAFRASRPSRFADHECTVGQTGLGTPGRRGASSASPRRPPVLGATPSARRIT